VLNHVTFDISAENHPDVLARIVLLLHRLAVHIRGLTTKRPKRSRTMHITVEVAARGDQTDRIAASLLTLVCVVSVKKRT